jgi:hypothetical protein
MNKYTDMKVDRTGLQTVLSSLLFTLYDDDDDDQHIYIIIIIIIIHCVISISLLPIFSPSLRLRVGYRLDEGTSYFSSKTSTLALGTTLSPTHRVPSAVSLG